MARPVPVARWAIALVVVSLLALAVFLMLAQRRKSVFVEIGAVPPIAEAGPILAGLSGGALIEGNAVRVVQDGAFFDVLLADVAAARSHVHLETFIWSEGEVSARTSLALMDAADRGVEVRLLMDAFGSRSRDEDEIERMREHGVRIATYRPLGLRDAHAQNYRDHRKIAVVDGRVAHVMGHGFADEWSGLGQDADHWRDAAVRIKGPAVARLQSLFAENWMESSGEGFTAPHALGAPTRAGAAAIQVAASASGDRLSNVALLMEGGIRAARSTLDVEMAYFAPSQRLLDALTAAAGRGVRVRILLPGAVTDSPPVQRAGRAHYETLLRAGIRIFEHQTTMLHQKVLIVDRAWSHVGSTNLDLRSLEMSDEVSLGIHDATVAADLERGFERDLRDAQEITQADVARRGPLERALLWTSRALREQL